MKVNSLFGLFSWPQQSWHFRIKSNPKSTNNCLIFSEIYEYVNLKNTILRINPVQANELSQFKNRIADQPII